MRVSSAVLRLVAEVPAALVQVAPVEVELFYHIFVMPLTPMVHLDGLLEGGAEVAIERWSRSKGFKGQTCRRGQAGVSCCRLMLAATLGFDRPRIGRSPPSSRGARDLGSWLLAS